MYDIVLSCDRLCWIAKNTARPQCPLTLIVELYKLNMMMKTMTKRTTQENKRFQKKVYVMVFITSIPPFWFRFIFSLI